MASQPQGPKLISPIPNQISAEGSMFGPLDLKQFIRAADPESGPVEFTVFLENSLPLPKGLSLVNQTEIAGIPEPGSAGSYTINILAENNSGISLQASFNLMIYPVHAIEIADAPDESLLAELKNRVWDAIGHNQPPPTIDEFTLTTVRPIDILYLLERWGSFSIWNSADLSAPSEKKLLQLEGVSPHFNVYDRGSSLIAAPKKLFSHERTLQDALQTARAMAQEVFKRGWTIEFSGLEKMQRAAWVELQVLGAESGRKPEVLHYTPRKEDNALIQNRSQTIGLRPEKGT